MIPYEIVVDTILLFYYKPLQRGHFLNFYNNPLTYFQDKSFRGKGHNILAITLIFFILDTSFYLTVEQ